MSTGFVKIPPKNGPEIIRQHTRSQISPPRELAKSAQLTTHAALSANAEGAPSAPAWLRSSSEGVFWGSAPPKKKVGVTIDKTIAATVETTSATVETTSATVETTSTVGKIITATVYPAAASANPSPSTGGTVTVLGQKKLHDFVKIIRDFSGWRLHKIAPASGSPMRGRLAIVRVFRLAIARAFRYAVVQASRYELCGRGAGVQRWIGGFAQHR